MKRGNGRGTLYRRQKGGFWYGAWWAGKHRRRKCFNTTYKATAELMLAQEVDQAAKRAGGLIDPVAEAIAINRSRSIEEHLRDFERKMQADARSKKHVGDTMRRIREFVTAAAISKLGDLTADKLNQHLANLGLGRTRKRRTSPRSRHAAAVAAKAFTKWLTDHGKLAHDPLRLLKRPNLKIDRRVRRRMLLPAEWDYLRPAVITAGERFGVDARERLTIYYTAIQTGLRSGELRDLIKTDLFFGITSRDRHADGSEQRLLFGNKPFIRARAETTKNEKEARQFIQPGLAAELQRLVARKLHSAPVFHMPAESECAAMLRADLADARKAWLGEAKDPDERLRREQSDFLAAKNHQGEVLDFHALRHTCGAWLAIGGLHPKTIQTVMRHSTIILTMDTYGHLLPEQHASAVDVMPSFNGPNPDTSEERSEGERTG